MRSETSVWALLAGIVDRPGRTLSEILAHPRGRWVMPALIAVAAAIVMAVASAPIVREQTSQAISGQLSQQLSQLPADQAAKVQSQMAFFESLPFVIGAQIGSGVLGLAFGWVFQAVIIYLSGLLAGADVSFVKLLGTAPWLGLPGALKALIQAAYVANKGQLVVNEGLSYLVSSGSATMDARNLGYVLMSFLNPFHIWQLVLVFALFRVGMKFSASTAFWLTVIFLAILVVARLGVGALSGMLSSGLG